MITLITGGARAGKSTLAERLATERADVVTYLATADVYDEDMEARVARHRAQRPRSWVTVETGPNLAGAVREAEGLVLVECLGTWLSHFPDFVVDPAELVTALRGRAEAIVVTNEVGMGVHPYTEIGRAFRDALGSLNRAVSEHADEVLLVVAGRCLRLE